MKSVVAPRDLGDGLHLRWTTVADAAAVSDFIARIWDPANPSERRRQGILASFAGHHPAVGPEDYLIVEDTTTGKIVATTSLLRQTWDYEGIPFAVGRPEDVGTLAAYRNRGLIRQIFATLHQRSDERGDLTQAITGIGYFYRQFGYEYALDLEGERVVRLTTLPEAPEQELYTLRSATLADLDFLRTLYDQHRAGTRVSTVVSAEFWQASLTTASLWKLLVIVDQAGQAAGYVRINPYRWGKQLGVWDIAAADGHALRPIGLAALRGLQTVGQAMDPDTPLEEISLQLGDEHPLYTVLGPTIAAVTNPPYAWMVRVANIPAFLQHVAPVLERRLTASPLAAYTGELCLNLYKGGARLVFQQGRIVEVSPWQVPADPGNRGIWMGVSIPPLVFLQLLFCYRSFAELIAHYPDVTSFDEALTPLVDALFPKGRSMVMMTD